MKKKCLDPIASVNNVDDAIYSTKLLAQTTLRNALGTTRLIIIIQLLFWMPEDLCLFWYKKKRLECHLLPKTIRFIAAQFSVDWLEEECRRFYKITANLHPTTSTLEPEIRKNVSSFCALFHRSETHKIKKVMIIYVSFELYSSNRQTRESMRNEESAKNNWQSNCRYEDANGDVDWERSDRPIVWDHSRWGNGALGSQGQDSHSFIV